MIIITTITLEQLHQQFLIKSIVYQTYITALPCTEGGKKKYVHSVAIYIFTQFFIQRIFNKKKKG